jgi:hypothetical protein
VNGQIFHSANKVEDIAAVLALTEAIPDILFRLNAELSRVAAFMYWTRAGQAVAAAFEDVKQIVMLQHLFHGDPGTDVPEINVRFLVFGHGIFSFRGSMCGSEIEQHLTENNTTQPQKPGLWKT